MKENFLLFRSAFDALCAVPAENAQRALQMIGQYAMDDVMPEPDDPVAYGLFLAVKPIYDNRKKKETAGRAGGTAKASKVLADASTSVAEASTDVADASTTLAEGYKKKKEKIKNKNISISPNGDMSGKPAAEYPYKAIIDYLNAKAGKKFEDKSKDTRRHIKARIDEGHTLEDFYRVIDNMVAKWKGDAKMDDYLRPSTLFGTKFESYLNVHVNLPPKNRFGAYPQRNYDFDALEAQLISAQGG